MKTKLDIDEILEININNRIFFAFYDLNDGNYIAADNEYNVYSLIHDAQPLAKKMKYSIAGILADIEGNNFDKDKHVDERYKNSR